MVVLYHWRVKSELFIQMITEVNFKTKAVLLPSRRGLCRVEASEYVGVSPNTFDRMIGDGKMPSAVQIYGRKVWDVRALDRAFDALSPKFDTSEANLPWSAWAGDVISRP